MADALCSLAQVKARLGLPAAADAERDAVLDAIRLAVEERILDRTGFAFTSGPFTDQRANVQLGITVVLRYRPVVGSVTLKARSLASSTFDTILGDLVDPDEGRVLPLAGELSANFPPVAGAPLWTRWRRAIWPVVKFTYSVDPLGSGTNPVPKSIVQAAIEWTSAVYSRPNGGAVKQYTAEKVSETFAEESVPRVVDVLLTRYTREKVVITA